MTTYFRRLEEGPQFYSLQVMLHGQLVGQSHMPPPGLQTLSCLSIMPEVTATAALYISFSLGSSQNVGKQLFVLCPVYATEMQSRPGADEVQVIPSAADESWRHTRQPETASQHPKHLGCA